MRNIDIVKQGAWLLDRLIAYVDGFNLYFGLKARGWKKLYWLNIKELCNNLSKPNQDLIITKYFTSRITKPKDKHKRQATFIEALMTLSGLEIFYGQYQSNPWTCHSCSATIDVFKEKMTDVNIAVELLTDAFQDNFDVALIVSADSDLKGPIQKTKELFPDKRIVVAFPPGRSSVELRNIADACFHIGRKKIADSLFPDQITKSDGFIIERPDNWK